MKKSILSVLLFFASAGLCAEATQSPEVLSHKVEEYVHKKLASYKEGKIQVNADRIDSRLSLKECAEDKLAVFNPYQSPILSTNTLGVKCKELDNHWSLYVPIRITILKTVYLAKRSLLKGELITKGDLYRAEINIHRLKNGYFNDINDLIGQSCKQNIPINTPLNPRYVELEKVIHKGEKVAIIMKNNNLIISMDGIAINEGAIGETVRVKNLSSKKIIEAQVAGKKKVNVII